MVGDSRPNGRVIPHTFFWGHPWEKKIQVQAEGLAAYQLVGGVMAHQGIDG